MQREHVENFLLKIISGYYIERSWCELTNNPQFSTGELKTVFRTPPLAAWAEFFNDRHKKETLILFLMDFFPDTFFQGELEGYEIFLTATLLSIISLYSSKAPEQLENIEDLLKEAGDWIVGKNERLQSFYRINKIEFSDYPYFLYHPLYHKLQLEYIAQFEKDYFDKYKKFRAALAADRQEINSKKVDEVANLKIFMQPAPEQVIPNKHPILNLSASMSFIRERNVRVILALGDVGYGKDVFCFPYIMPEANFRANDFYNYFGIELNSNDPYWVGRMPYLPVISVVNKESSYQLYEEFNVKTKEIDELNSQRDISALFSCNWRNFLMQVSKPKEEVPHSVVVHNLQVYDGNPVALSDAQLKLLMDSLIKAKVEEFAVLIHCRAGLGRTGMFAYIAARMFCSEMPVESEKALKWLRQFRPGVASTVEQLICAEEISKRIMSLLVQYKTANGYNWQEYYDKYQLSQHLPLITSDVKAKQAAKTAVDAISSTNSPINSGKKTDEAWVLDEKHPKELMPPLPKLGP